jgi:hypothetical protein
MLPTSVNGVGRKQSQGRVMATYFRRIVKPKQMDFEYVLLEC